VSSEPGAGHTFDSITSIVCWETEIKNGEKVIDLADEERTMKIIPADQEHKHTGYFLQRDRKVDIEVFVLRHYLKDMLSLEFRPRTVSEIS
jgi:hypothetical protein